MFEVSWYSCSLSISEEPLHPSSIIDQTMDELIDHEKAIEQQEKELLNELRDISKRHEMMRCISNTKNKPYFSDNMNVSSAAKFLDTRKENASYNQYWYSHETITHLCSLIIEAHACIPENQRRIAFLSTPSLYFSMPNEVRLQSCNLFDYDRQFGVDDDRFIFYDYNHPTKFECGSVDVSGQLERKFSMVVIDPPFITNEVWAKYALTTKHLLCADTGLVILTTISENSKLLKELFGEKVQSSNFQPSIPNLVYQYSIFTNFDCPGWHPIIKTSVSSKF